MREMSRDSVMYPFVVQQKLPSLRHSNRSIRMGRAKQEMMETQERGWSAPDDKFVCPKCVEDSFLRGLIAKQACSDTCSYCGNKSRANLAAPLDVLMYTIASAVNYSFREPSEAGVPWDEGEYVTDLWETSDVLQALELHCHDELFDDIVDAFQNDAWVRAAGGHWASSHEHEALQDSWNSFVSTVRHETRFNFHVAAPSESAGPQEIEPEHLLQTIGDLVKSAALIKQLPSGTLFYRVRTRVGRDDWALNADELGPPPPAIARAGRMNPAGIAYLYLAMDQATALAETISSPPISCAVATYSARRELTIIDLSDPPEIPSIFDDHLRRKREGLLFLTSFAREISQPILKDGSEHVSYVPSQVVSEYFAQVFKTADTNSVDGVMYRSAIRPNGKNLVLFPTERGWHRKFDTVKFVEAHEQRLKDWSDIVTSLGK